MILFSFLSSLIFAIELKDFFKKNIWVLTSYKIDGLQIDPSFCGLFSEDVVLSGAEGDLGLGSPTYLLLYLLCASVVTPMDRSSVPSVLSSRNFRSSVSAVQSVLLNLCIK